MRTPAALSFVLAALLASAPAGAGAQVVPGSGGQAAAAAARQGKLLTRQELLATGAPNLHEALRRLRRDWLEFDASRSVFPSVYVDGERAGEVSALRGIAVEDVLWVQYSDPVEARERFPSVLEAAAIHVSLTLSISEVHPPLARSEAWESRMGVTVSTFARRALGTEDYFGDAGNAPGIAAGVEVPLRPNLLATATVSYGTLERSCPCPDSVPGRTLTARVAAAGLGLKIRGSSREVYAPYFLIGAEVLRAEWDGVVIGGVREYLIEPADWGYGGTAGVGLDFRLSGRFLAVLQADASISQFPRRWAGPTRSLRVGTTYLLGSPR
jgi:hypothetical protein